MTESERVDLSSRLIARAEDVFGSREKADLWLKEPNRALELQTPHSLLETDEGAKQVEDIFIRIEHGVFS